MVVRRWVARTGVAALLSFAAVAVSWGPGARAASACDCTGPSDDATAVDGSDAAFTGTLVERSDPEPLVTSADSVRYVFDIELVHKGTIESRVEVESAWSSASCGAVIAEKSPMLVIAHAQDERLITTQCSGTRRITEFDGPPEIDGWRPAPSPTGEPDAPPAARDVAATATRTPCEKDAEDCNDQSRNAVHRIVLSMPVAAAVAIAGIVGGVWLVRRPSR